MGVKSLDYSQVHSYVSSNLSPWKANQNHRQHILSQFKDEASNLQELLKRTFTLGESNSVLIIGPRGCGKSALLNAVIDEVGDNGVLNQGIIIRLSGLLQTDDRLALREITKQLNVDEELSCKFTSFAENMNYVLKSFMSGSRESSKPILFILDEFDLFCHHHNQTLLYSLFDISQSSQAPICVIGLTSRLDIIELLEKRVKSRFSHRQIFLFAPEDFDEYLNVTKSLLRVDEEGISSMEVSENWNTSIEDLFRNSEIKQIFKNRFCLQRDYRNLKLFLFMVMAHVNSEDSFLKLTHFREAEIQVTQEARSKIIESLSTLQLTLLVAMKHLYSIYDGEPFNFEMVFKQYCKVGEIHSSMKSYERPVVFKAFDQLECLELIRPVEYRKTSLQREYRLMHLLITPGQIEEAITGNSSLPTFLTHWASSSII